MSLDPRDARVMFRERSGVEVLDLALRFVVGHLPTYGRLALVTSLPGFALAWTLARATGGVWGWCFALAIASVVGVPFTVLASRLAFAEHVPVREVLGASLRGLGGALVLRGVAVTLAVVGSFVLVLPGIWIYLVLWFTSEVALLEGSTLSASLVRAMSVAQAAFGETLISVLLLLSVLTAAVLLGDVAGRTVLGGLLEVKPPRSLFDEGWSVLGLLGLFAALPYVATARFFAYLDARTRAEGWDVQTAFAALVAREAETETPR